MLLRFGCSNFRSICEYQELLLTASSDSDHMNHTFSNKAVRDKILPVTAIYGANGAGKTNMLRAIQFFVRTIVLSKKRELDDVSIPYFKLDDSYQDIETSFDIDFILNEKHYHYGYSILDGIIQNEWLYSFTYNVRQSRSVLFFREKSETEFYFSKNFKGKNKTISSITGESSLFLSKAANSGHEICEEIYNFFSDNFNFRFRNDVNEHQISQKIEKYDLTKDIQKFLSKIDIGVTDLKTGKKEIEEIELEMRGKFLDVINSLVGNDKSDPAIRYKEDEYKNYIQLIKKDQNGKEIAFDFDDESLGTKSLISLLASVFLIIRKGGIFVVDELELSLHTLLSLKVLEIFKSSDSNSNGAQLIFSTHETQLLCSGLLRKDEIWLAERSLSGRSVITPLSDFSIPKNSNIRNGYLNGRFGAIPFPSNNFSIESIWS